MVRREFIGDLARGAAAMVCCSSRLQPLVILALRETKQASPPIWYDSDGLIVHRGMNGGDTAQREGWYWFGVWIRQNVLHDPWTVPRKLTFPDVLRLLEPKQDGVFYRHPKLPPWNNPYNEEYGLSRDQMVPLMAAMGVWSLHDPSFGEPLRRFWNALPQDQLGGPSTPLTVSGGRRISSTLFIAEIL